MLIFLVLVAVSVAAPVEKHPKWATHPDIQCSKPVVMLDLALLVTKNSFLIG